MSTFAERIKQYRKDQNLTQGELADKLEIARSVIGDSEIGRRIPSKKTLQKLAKLSGKSLDWWLEGAEPIPENNSPLATTEMIIEKLIKEGLIVDGNIDDEVAHILLNSLKVDIELKLKQNK